MDDAHQVDEVKIEEVGRNYGRRNFRECWPCSCHVLANAFGKVVFSNCFVL